MIGRGGAVSDQAWGALVAFCTVVGLRIVDWFLPRGRYSRWAERHSVRAEKRAEEEED